MNANFQARSTDKSEVLVIGLKSLLYKYPRRAINTDMIMINASSVLQTSWRWWEDKEYVLSYFFFSFYIFNDIVIWSDDGTFKAQPCYPNYKLKASY